MKKRIVYIILLYVCAACSRTIAERDDSYRTDSEQHQSPVYKDEYERGDTEIEAEDVVVITPVQAKKIDLSLGVIEDKGLASSIKVTGKLALPPQNKAHISPLMGGKVVQISVIQGQYVAQGQTLAYLENPALIDLQQQYLETESQLIYLEQEEQRQAKLWEKAVIGEKAYQKVQADLRVMQARNQGLQAKLNMLGIKVDSAQVEWQDRLPIKSPINGFVRDIYVATGEYVEAQFQMFEVLDNHHVHVDLIVYEKDLDYLAVNQLINFNLPKKPTEIYQARIFSIGKALNEADQTIMVHAEIDNNTEELLPGMFVEGRIITNQQKIPSLPESAVVQDKDLAYIFIKERQGAENYRFKRIPVLKGVQDMGYVAIDPLVSIAPEDTVVITGAYFLLAQIRKGEGGGEHH